MARLYAAIHDYYAGKNAGDIIDELPVSHRVYYKIKHGMPITASALGKVANAIKRNPSEFLEL